jgi:lipoprotein-anchoring transpeptidase ErfK/SrfK
VLKLQFAVEQRPAARNRRPLLCAAAIASATLLAGCAEQRPPDVDGARRAVRNAIHLVRPEAPQQARYLERLAADAEIATAGELASRNQAGRGQAAWLRAVIAAHSACSSYRTQRDSARARYEALYPLVDAHMKRAGAEIHEAGMGRREAAAIERATIAVKTALRFAAAGRYGPAADKLEVARDMAEVVHKAWRAVHQRFEDPRLLAFWRSWAEAGLAESRQTGRVVMLVDKLRRHLAVYQGGVKIATFSAELGANGLQRKAHSGDRATPEGSYRVVERKQGSATNYYKALLINYPNDEDRARFADGKRVGTIPRRAGIGGLIEIHGEGGEGRDWTDGCVALTNQDMDWLFDRAPVGTLVVIVGTT